MMSVRRSSSSLYFRRAFLDGIRRLPFSSEPTIESQSQKLERIADELISLTKLERFDYTILLRHKLGFQNYGPVVPGLGSSGSPSSAGAASTTLSEEKKADKTAFDIKLDKFDAAAKIKIIKEVRSFTNLGLKEAKDLVEKAPVVLKKGVVKEEAEQIVAKLKELGATVVLE